MITLRYEDKEFNKALMELVDESSREDDEVITSTARSILRKLAWHTPRAEGRFHFRGRARGGWWKSWKALGMSGSPYVRNDNLDEREGDMIDMRHRRGGPYVVLINMVRFIELLERKVAYWIEPMPIRSDT